MIEPVFFGPEDQQLFAIYHPPTTGPGEVLTLICPPLFNEYMRTHPALRDLAVALAENGQHVLRLDYAGTGDSFGELEEIVLSDWIEGVALALREGREITGSKVVRLVGVRAGALLACKLAGTCFDVDRVVLWDPIPDGAGYLQAMHRVQKTIIERGLSTDNEISRETMHEYAGYRLSERMVEEFQLLDSSVYSSVPLNKLHIVSTSPEAGFVVPGGQKDLIPFACQWETDLDNLLIPRPVLERLVTACVTRA